MLVLLFLALFLVITGTTLSVITVLALKSSAKGEESGLNAMRPKPLRKLPMDIVLIPSYPREVVNVRKQPPRKAQPRRKIRRVIKGEKE